MIISMSYVIWDVKKPLFIFSSNAPSSRNNRTFLEFIGISLSFFDMIQMARGNFRLPFFMETFSTTAWDIWKQRNNLIF